MAATPSTMIPLGTPAPAFSLPDYSPQGVAAGAGGTPRLVSLSHFADRQALVVAFICNHCPFVKHIRAGLAALAKDYQPRGVGIVAISSNNIETHPDDAPAKMTAECREAGYIFPYLYDATQEVAKAYRAACTPDFYVFDSARRLVYRGQMDDSRPSKYARGDIPVTGADLRAALDATLAGRPVPGEQKASLGCNIKWKPGNEPDYAR